MTEYVTRVENYYVFHSVCFTVLFCIGLLYFVIGFDLSVYCSVNLYSLSLKFYIYPLYNFPNYLLYLLYVLV